MRLEAEVVAGLVNETLFRLMVSYVPGRERHMSMMWKHDFTLQKIQKIDQLLMLTMILKKKSLCNPLKILRLQTGRHSI